jgi:hypothetical protein
MIVRFDSPHFPPELPRRRYVAAVYGSESWSGCLCLAKYLGTCNSWDLRGFRVIFVPDVTNFHSCCCTVHIVNCSIVYLLMHIHTTFLIFNTRKFSEMFRPKDHPQGATLSLLKSLLKTSYWLLALYNTVSGAACLVGCIKQQSTGRTHLVGQS